MPYTGFPGGSVIKNLPANSGDLGSVLGSRRSPGVLGQEEMEPTPVFLARKSLGQRSVEGSKVHNLNSWDRKGWTQLSD